jgi:hypothetical protein
MTAEGFYTVSSAVAILLTLYYVARQVTEGRRSAYATSFATLYAVLQAKDVTEARRHVMTTLATKSRPTWDQHDREQANIVCSTYDAAGIMCRKGLIPVEIVADSWGDSIRRCWTTLGPHTQSLRSAHGQEKWDDFEWLAEQANGRPWSKGRLVRARVAVGTWISP